jgi:hypothetical protein
MADVTVNDWVNDYVTTIFLNRGFDPVDDKSVAALIDSQWDNWKRLMVKSGLNADRTLADDTAFEFASKRVTGGAAGIFPAFSALATGLPTPEIVPESNRAYDKEDCDTCGNVGVIMVATARGQVSFGCKCMNAIKYAGIPKATPDQLAQAWREQREEADRLRTWAMDRGMDYDGNLDDFRANFRRWFESAGTTKAMFAKAC